MKRTFAIIALGLILASVVASCKGTGHLCESYGNKSADAQQVESSELPS